MPEVRFVRIAPAVEAAMQADPAYFQAMADEDWPTLADVILRHVGRTLPERQSDEDRLHWGGYCVVDAGTRDVVGSCAYKGPPSDAGEVEIAYFTHPGFEGRGYATEMARKLIDLAYGSEGVRSVIAHTLPRESASTRVLQKAAMALAGEVTDPEDGAVWRWAHGVDA